MHEEKIISLEGSDYPKLLKEISDAPPRLHIRGELLPDEPCFAIVGTRLCSNYGKQVALDIAGDLAEAGLTIVSGLAPGIDTHAHRAVVERRKRTIAAVGTGLDEESLYPKENKKLAESILEVGGALVSEYPPGTKGTQYTFPQRNRIISGLCLGVLVVEAKEKSGSLITAEYAVKQKRKLFAVPGPIHSLNSRGTHYAIKKLGAGLVESADDILEALNLPFAKKTDRVAGENEEEKAILEALGEGALHIEKIIEKTQFSSAKTAGTLAILEMKGKVRNLGGNTFALAR